MTATVGGHILTTAGRARSELEAVARRLAFPVGLGTSVAVKRVAPAHANEGVTCILMSLAGEVRRHKEPRHKEPYQTFSMEGAGRTATPAVTRPPRVHTSPSTRPG